MLRLDAKGAVQKPASIPTGAPGALLPPPSLSGAHLEVLEQGLAAGLPLNPGTSLALPVRVVVGKPQGSYDGSTLQVCVCRCGCVGVCGCLKACLQSCVLCLVVFPKTH